MAGFTQIEEITNCYLVFGEEEFIKEKVLKSIKDKTVSEDDIMNFSYFEGKDSMVDEMINAGETMPFLADYKVVLVKESGLFKTGKKDESQQLAKWMENIPPQTVIIFLEKEVDKRNQLYKVVNKKYKAIECVAPDDRELAELIGIECKKRNISMKPRVIQYFLVNMPRNITHILGELEKIESYCFGREVTTDDIEAICVFALEQRIFGLIKEVAQKHTTEAITIYNKLIESKESPIAILVLIARQYRILLQVKYLVKRNMPSKQIGMEVGLPFFVVKESIDQAAMFSFKQLQDIVEKCLESDISIKTGRMEPVKCIELLIMECIYI